MSCSECGAPLKENQKFCTECGAGGDAGRGQEALAPPSISRGAMPAGQRPGKSGFLWGGIAAAGAILVVVVVFLSRSTGHVSLTKTVRVPGNQGWTPTGIFLKPGAAINIVASGSVSMGAGWTPLPPAGNAQTLCSFGFPLPQVPCWSLIGRIGDRGTPFYVGNRIALRVPAAGELFFGVNDDALGDNSGQWTAVVSVNSGSATPPPPAGQPVVTHPAKIIGLSPIASPRDRIVITGSGFGDYPQTVPLGDGSVDTVAGPDSPWLSVIQNVQTAANGSAVSHGWAAGTLRGADRNGIGVNLVKWTDTEIVLNGFGPALGPGQPFNLQPGDTLTFLICGPNNHCGPDYAAFAATPEKGGASATVTVQPVPVQPVSGSSGANIQAFLRPGQTSIELPPGNFYIYGMATGGGAPSDPFTIRPDAKVADAAGVISAALSSGTNSQNNFTTNTEYYVIGGAAITGSWLAVDPYYGFNAQPGASSASVSFPVMAKSFVVAIGLASSQQSVELAGIPGLQVDASSSGPGAVEGMVIAHGYVSPGTYLASMRSSALAGGQDPAHMADLIGVFVFRLER